MRIIVDTDTEEVFDLNNELLGTTEVKRIAWLPGAGSFGKQWTVDITLRMTHIPKPQTDRRGKGRRIKV